VREKLLTNVWAKVVWMGIVKMLITKKKSEVDQVLKREEEWELEDQDLIRVEMELLG
jgi:hypothetical protein